MADQKGQDTDKETLDKNIRRRVVQVAFWLVLGTSILFISAGRIDWESAWIYTIVTISIALTGAIILPHELISERGRKKENVEKWDSIIIKLILVPWFAQYLVSGLDFRFRWSPELALPVHIAALAIYLLGYALTFWSMLANAYFSTSVRIQYDRGHTVCTSGPYRYIRHPGYLGMIAYYSATSIILGSIWGLMPAAIIATLLIIRIVLEDRTLKNKLEGYKEYADKVKYRLIPGVW